MSRDQTTAAPPWASNDHVLMRASVHTGGSPDLNFGGHRKFKSHLNVTTGPVSHACLSRYSGPSIGCTSCDSPGSLAQSNQYPR
jgi:hypothetical protein